jgi:hypothetical protein
LRQAPRAARRIRRRQLTRASTCAALGCTKGIALANVVTNIQRRRVAIARSFAMYATDGGGPGGALVLRVVRFYNACALRSFKHGRC